MDTVKLRQVKCSVKGRGFRIHTRWQESVTKNGLQAKDSILEEVHRFIDWEKILRCCLIRIEKGFQNPLKACSDVLYVDLIQYTVIRRLEEHTIVFKMSIEVDTASIGILGLTFLRFRTRMTVEMA
jgi:hypothetical protein